MGIGLYPRDGKEADELLRNADIAMYRAKEEGRNGYQFFNEAFTQAALQDALIDHALKGALERNEFRLLYQPQFDLNTGRLIGAEALLRWHHHQHGDLSPADFIPVAEHNGLIMEIGRWVFQTACQQAKAWHDAGLDVGRIAVNVSGYQIRAPNFADEVQDLLATTECSAQWLELEVTESFVMRRLEHSVAQLNQLRALGVQIAIDDFGTGYSSLSYLKRLPIDKLKIDQAFVRDINTDPNDKAIAASIIAMGHALGKTIIAEGVETEAHVEFLMSKHCDQVQGYLYARPLSAEHFQARLLKTDSALSV
jgi:EAL domain-containing protein (putative c-di-GMP-specific phosphodiesterase class I)